jgi:hypothetical protein
MTETQRLAKIFELSTAMADCSCLLCWDCTERLGEIQELADGGTTVSVERANEQAHRSLR